MTTTLSQIVAIHTGVKADAARRLTEAHHRLQKSDLISGLIRTYQPFDDDEREQLPPESKQVQLSAAAQIAQVQKVLARLFDVTATKDRTNCDARAAVVVDGEVLAEDVPVTYLLWLEKQLVDLRTFISKLPTLDPAETWSYDNNGGYWASKPATTMRSRKVHRSHVKWEPPDSSYTQPAQVDTYTEDVAVGRWTNQRLSGALPGSARAEMLERVTKLTEAVKKARETANATPVTDMTPGHRIMSWLFAPAV